MNKKIGFRFWYYFRQGWATYFAFIFSALNTLVVTYYLAIENIPVLQAIFPSFVSYFLVVMIIGIPILVLAGYIHFRRIPAYSSELDIGVYSNPWFFKIRPGYDQKVVFPMYRILTIMLLKLSNDEKLDDKEIKEIQNILKNIDHLISGGFVNKPKNMS